MLKFEQPINSYSISKNWDSGKDVTFENVKSAINESMKKVYGETNYKDAQAVIGLINELWKENDKKELQTIYEKAKVDCTKFLKDIKVCK